MDVRSRNIADPTLSETALSNCPKKNGAIMFGKPAWAKPTLPSPRREPSVGWTAQGPRRANIRLHLEWDAQVPGKYIRLDEQARSNMTQWYPRLCEYDHHGWHTNPHIGREFHGVWGDYDVTIHMPAAYMIGGTGVREP